MTKKAAKKDEPNKPLKIGRLTITGILYERSVLQIFATDRGIKREFVSHKGGALEVYDFPGKAGLARFVGHLNKEGAIKLYQLAGEWATKQAAKQAAKKSR